MAKDKKIDYKTKDVAFLKAEAKKLSLEVWKLKSAIAVGKVKDTSQVSKTRKNIARILGIIAQKEQVKE